MDNIHIPDDIFHFLATFLTPLDCMSFCLSGVSSGFTAFYSRRRIWKLSRCFCLEPNICQQYFSKCLVSSNVEVLDLSHCFWLPEDTFFNGFFSSELKNLTELNVLDTKLSLVSVILQVMPQCQGLTKLSVNILEPTWEDFYKKLQGFPATYKENFKKITDLKLYTLDCSSPYIWILLFNILGWCRDCVQLHMQLFKSKIICRGSPCEYNQSECKSVIQLLSRRKIYDGLKWMISLKGLCVLTIQPDRCLDDFCRWLLQEINPPALEKLWIPSVKSSSSIFKPGPSLKCLNVGRLDYPFDFSSVALSHVTHLAGIEVNSDLKLPQLRFIRGDFLSCSVLDEFCSSHPLLEHLHFDGYDCTASSQENGITFQCQWALARLRTLIFANNPHPDVLSKFMHSCSKLEELHVGRLTSSIFFAQEPVHEAYRSISKQTHLRKLTLSGLEFTCGSFLQQVRLDFRVLENCQKLEILHIAGQFEDSETFFCDLSKYLPLAKNLRDLRMQKSIIPQSLLMDLIFSIGLCPTLERLMIYQDEFGIVDEPLQSFLPKCLKDLVANRLPRLVVFCFIYPVSSETEIEISLELGTTRPSLWYHVNSSDLPKNTKSPRVHLDEFIDPFPYIDFFPVFG